MTEALSFLVDHLLDLENIEVNIFRGTQPAEDRQRVFGGQVAAQALMAAGRTDSDAVRRGIAYLVRTKKEAGGWTENLYNAVGFARVFYLKYHLYAKYFPLWALGVYRSSQA